MSIAKKLAGNLKKYMLLYTIITALAAVIVGSSIPLIAKFPPKTFKSIVMLLAATTIFPSMILLRGEKLGSALKRIRYVLIVILYAYALSPVLAYFASATISNPDIRIGFLAANTVPASAASIGYVMLAEGDLELATACIFILVALGTVLIPTYLCIYASMMTVNVPISEIVKPVIAVLVIPLIIGQLARRYIIKKKGVSFIESELKPYLSASTVLVMLLLIFILISRKAMLILKEPYTTLGILATYSLIVFTIIMVGLAVSKLLKIGYKAHQAIMFLSITKNESVAAAVATCGFGPTAALAPALIPSIQPVLAIAYLHAEKLVKRICRQA
ncbi:MAG TPA: arsenic resistance protein [Thermofilum sp.]|nr:arsenic resistance protein [Thermofilum sp.]